MCGMPIAMPAPLAALGPADAAWAATGLLAALACEPTNCPALLDRCDEVVTAVLTALRRHPADENICWAASCLLLKLSECCAVAPAVGAADSTDAAPSAASATAGTALPLLEDGILAVLDSAVQPASEGAAASGDARIASAAVAAVQALLSASSARGRSVKLAVRDAVQALLAAHDRPVAAAVSAGPAAGGRSTDVVARCRAVLLDWKV